MLLRKRGWKSVICVLLCIAMMLSLCVTALAENDTTSQPQPNLGIPDLVRVPQDISTSVAYGTAEEKAMQQLPTTVNVSVEDLTPYVEVEEKTYTFNDNTLPEGWTSVCGTYSLSDGRLHVDAQENVKLICGDVNMTDYVVEVDLQGDGTVGADFGLIFRCEEVTDETPDTFYGYYVGVGRLDNDPNAADRSTGVKAGFGTGAWNQIGTYTTDKVNPSEVTRLKVVVYGNTFTTFVKGERDSDYTKIMSSTTELHPNGFIGLRSYKQAFFADNLTIRAVTDEDLAAAGIAREVEVAAEVERWTCDTTYQGTVPGTYTYTGTLKESEQFDNSNHLTAKATITVREQPKQVNQTHSVPFSQVTVRDEFWSARQKWFICEVIPTAIERISTGSGGMLNFKTAAEYLAKKLKENPDGTFTTTDAPAHQGAIYVDSDDYKVIEAMSYALQLDANGDAEMIAGQAAIAEQLEEWIPWIVGAQEPDGYLYTSYTLSGSGVDGITRCNGRRDDMAIQPDGTPYSTVGTDEFTANFASNHELYNFGHFYEAAVAHYRATGDFRLLDVAVKNADMVVRTFGYGKKQVQAAPGHEEIELALLKLAALCEEIGTANGVDYGDKAQGYIDVAKFFLDVRGKAEYGTNMGSYLQADKPIAEQTTAYGHCVRAQYLYTGMADVALMEIAAGHENPYENLLQIWEDATYTKTYITGGIGIRNGEAFPESYQLPNDSNTYCETCAQISNAMWNQRMNLLYGGSEFIDVIERELYTSILSCVNFDADAFFYENHMLSDRDFERSAWFGTACCPPNLMRTVMSIGGYIYAQQADGSISVNQYIGNDAQINVKGDIVNLSMTANMPWDCDVTMHVEASGDQTFTIYFRVPGWADGENTVTVNGQSVSAEANEDGYVEITRAWGADDVVELHFPMEAKRVYTDEKVAAGKDQVAVQRGPVVYCAEEWDNADFDITTATLSTDAELVVGEMTRLPGRTGEDHYNIESFRPITAESTTTNVMSGETSTVNWTFIPYYAWQNRGKSTMRVLVKENTEFDPSQPLESYAKATADVNCATNSSPSNLNDGSKAALSRWAAWDCENLNNNYVQYTFDAPVEITKCMVTWYDDGDGCQVPDGLTIKYLNDAGEWVSVSNMTSTGFPKNGDSCTDENAQEGVYTFDKITTTAIRLYPTNTKAQMQSARPAIIEWRLEGQFCFLGDIDHVEELIAALPETVTLDDEDAIEAARAAYDALAKAHQAMVSNSAKLLDAEAQLAELKHALVKIDAVEPTCTTDGVKEYWQCTKCHLYFSDAAGKHEITDLDAWKSGEGKITATGHTLTLVPAEAATCAAMGHTAYYTCSGCNEWFADAEGKKIISDHSSVITDKDPNNHTGGTEIRGAKAATATEDGYTGDTYCLGCGAMLAKGQVIPATGGSSGGIILPILPVNPGTPSYELPFVDVPEGEWYYESVYYAWDAGLINGTSPTTFRPDNTLTVAEAIKLAAALHQLESEGKVTLRNGQVNWYDTYVAYAVKEGIIEAKYQRYTVSQMNAPATRREFVHILHGALDDYAAINAIGENAIPDVKTGDTYAAEIYDFYRAGILTGSNAEGTFHPESSIKRSEVAAILIRMYDEDMRLEKTL